MSADHELVHVGTVLDAEEDKDLVQMTGFQTLFSGFFGDAKAFFTKARDLETEALEAEAAAVSVRITDVDSHKRVLESIKDRKQSKRAAEDHWDVTTKISGFHKLLTGRRGVTTEANDRCVKTLERESQRWEASERQRVADENRVLEEKARAEAKRKQDEEAALMEQEALAREAVLDTLSEKQQNFVARILKGEPQGRACKASGYKDAEYADTLMAMPKVVQAISAAREAQAIREQAAAVKAEPPRPQPIERVEANVATVKGLSKNFTHSCKITDRDKFLAGVKAGDIPIDAVMPDQSTLNAYAKAMGVKINRWPGCEYEKKEGTRG